jgi:hypothetical protein
MNALPTRLATLAISLPMFHSMMAQDMGDVVQALGKVLTNLNGNMKGKASARICSRAGNQNKSCPELPNG